MQKAHIELLVSAECKRGQLRYLGMRDLELPLPTPLVPEDFEANGSQIGA
jgi:hypothetical protein